MRRHAIGFGAACLLAATLGSAAPTPAPTSADQRLAEARKLAIEARQAAQKLRTEADRAGDAAERARLGQRMLAEQISALEAEISEATLQLEAVQRELAKHQAEMDKARAPTAALVASLATMARQPPLIAIADAGSVNELVRVQALIDASLPIVEQRARALERGAAATRQLEADARSALAALEGKRKERDEARLQFARQEAEQRAAAMALADAAFDADRRRAAVVENVSELADTADRRRAAIREAEALAAYPAAAPQKGRSGSKLDPTEKGPAAYRLPSSAPVIQGLSSLSPDGVRSRGLVLDSARGSEVMAPAAGRIAFVGAFRDYDGLVIIDHGGGWVSLLIDVASTLSVGDRVTAGQPLGRALGPIGVELWHKGVPRSSALIAGSSEILSKSGQAG